MGLPVEFFSLFIPRSVIEEKYPGGLKQYEADCPNGTFLVDEFLTRVAFMSPIEVDNYMTVLVAKGLEFDEEEPEAGDMVVITNFFGFHWKVPWCYQHIVDDLIYFNGEEGE